MSIFKKLFGRSADQTPSVAEAKPEIAKPLATGDTTTVIDRLDQYISKKCSWGDNLERLNEQQTTFYLTQTLARELNNGGFDQFFFNASGDYCMQTIAALRSIGATHSLALLEQAVAMFPGSTVPTDRLTRQDALVSMEEKSEEIWEDLDAAFYTHAQEITTTTIAYIRLHQDKF